MRKPVAVLVVMACFMAALASGGGQVAEAAPPGDSTAALQAKFDQLKPGETLTLDPGTYQHSGIIYLRVPGVRIDGNDATLQATNDPTSALWIAADNVSLSNLNLTAPLGGPRYYDTDQHKLVIAGNGATVSDVTITGSAAAGVFVGKVSDFRLDRVTVRDTRADGIQMSAGASNGQVNNPTTERTGDDGIAVVSYTKGLLCRNIVINSPVVNGTTQARGIVVVGGDNIAIRNIKVSQTSAAGVVIASVGDPYYTQSTNAVEVTGGSVTGANMTPSVDEPDAAVAVYSQNRGESVTNATVSDLTIADTPPSAQSNIAVAANNGGILGNIAFRNIQIQQQTDRPAVSSNAPRDSYITSGFTMNGTPIDVP
jgi:hypothetical protein